MSAHRAPSPLRQWYRRWVNRPETLADLSLYAKGDCGPRFPLSNVTLAGADLPGPGKDAPGNTSPGITGAGEPDPQAGTS